MIWYMYTLWNVYHNQHIHYFIWLPQVCVFVCVCADGEIYTLNKISVYNI